MDLAKDSRSEITDIKEFLANTQYLKQIIKDVKNKSDIDSNIYYELVLGKMKYEDVLSNCEDPQIAEECKSMICSIESIIDGFTQKELSDILSKETKDIQKYDKVKYYNIKDTVFNGGIKKPYEVTNNEGSLAFYFKNRIVTLILIFFVIVPCLLTGATRYITDSIVNICFGTTDSIDKIVPDDETKSKDSKIKDKSKDKANELDNIGLKPNESVRKSLKSMDNLIRIIINFMLMAMMCYTNLATMIDLLYITIPLFRDMVEEERSGLRSLISTTAQDAVKLEYTCGKTVIYRSINNANRIKRNEEMLEYLLTKNPDSVELKQLKKEITDYKNTKLFYNRIAKVEFIIDELFKQGKLKTA